MLNRAVLVGRLVKDVDLRYTSSGIAVSNFVIACNRPFKSENGEQEADFINCVAWRKQAENLANYMRKGSLIGVEGRIQTRSYDDKDGKRVYVTEVLAESVQFLDPKGSNSAATSNYGQTNSNTPPTQEQAANALYGTVNDKQQVDINDSDLPF